jgi:tetratricopeptide (TPR) repeat protein
VNNLALTHSDDPDVLHEWASSEGDMGDYYIDIKDDARAEKYFRRSLVAAEKLRALKPDDLAAISDVALPHMKLGRILASRHDLAGALQEQQLAFAMREAYAKNHPDNATAQRQVARSYAGMGSVQEAMGDLPLAIASYQKSVDFTRKLSAADPSNHQFTDDLDAETKQLEAAKQKLKATHRPHAEAGSIPLRK